jgi:hypothetical protein
MVHATPDESVKKRGMLRGATGDLESDVSNMGASGNGPDGLGDSSTVALEAESRQRQLTSRIEPPPRGSGSMRDARWSISSGAFPAQSA